MKKPYPNYPDSLMTDWSSYLPTPVEIIDSTVTDGNKWYKIKGAKLIKEEIDNLSRWGDWDTVRDSLFNLDDMGNKIRQDKRNREHWIYHTLVHRFQNNSFKDGKYSASKVVEAWYKKVNYKQVNDYVNFTIDGYNVKGKLGYHPSEMDGTTCDIYGNKSTDGKHLNIKSTCYSEGETYEGGTYKITLMDNNAFKLDFTSLRGNYFAYNFYRYEFEEDIYAETKFKRGQYKVFLNEIDEKAAAGNQGIDKNNFINTTEIILNISDDINGIYSYFSWGYDSQSCKFSSGETKNENTVGFTLECSSEGNKYDAGSYSIEIMDESTLRWKSDDGRFEKDFNYTFIPEE